MQEQIYATYLEYRDESQRRTALETIQTAKRFETTRRLEGAYTWVVGVYENQSPKVLQIDFQGRHDDLQTICLLTGAVRATHDNQEIWPRG